MAKSPKPEDFAGTLTLSGTGGSLLSFEIPEEVYQGFERSDRGDIRLFDAQGVLVPFLIRPVPGTVIQPPAEEVPFFRWQQGSGTLPGSADIEIDTSGAVVKIRSPGTAGRTAQTYLLDLSALSHPPVSLTLTLEEAAEFYHSPAAILTSKDLSYWKEYEKKQTIAWFGDSGTNRNTLELPQTDRSNELIKYVLLKFDQEIPIPRGFRAVAKATEIPAAPRESLVRGEKQQDGKTIDYHIKGFYPLTAIEFRLPEADSITVNIKYKFTPEDDDWHFFATKNLYRLRSGNAASSTGDGNRELKNPALTLSESLPLWELETAGDQVFSSVPDCYFTWEPREIIFLGRGTGPWTVAWGNTGVGASGDSSLKLADFADGDPRIEKAIPQGPSRYREASSPVKKSGVPGQWVLWAILILAVIVLSSLAYYVARSMGKGK